ncbi:MAG: M48 family metallopeptidase [Bacteroidales bacterium]|nr:M48 family metallopeptidase [Bacteroidales bacterium]
MQYLSINNIDIQVERKPIKNLHLSVYPPDGRVHVSAPEEYTDEKIKLYINKKWAWITEKRAAMTSFNIQSAREYISGEAHYFMGQLYRLKVVRDGRFPQHVEIEGDYIKVTVRPQAEPQHIEGVLYAWYKEQLTPVISGMVDKYIEMLGVEPEHWEVRKMAARWGSCSMAKKKILFNIELAKKPKDCIEYVVLHEMAHLICRTHSKVFRKILDTNLPNWVNIKEDLNEFPL